MNSGMNMMLFCSSWVFQTLMTTRTSSTTETWRRKQRQTISRWVLANNMLSEVDRPSTGSSVASFPLFFPSSKPSSHFYCFMICTIICLTHSHTCTTACYNARFHPLPCCKEKHYHQTFHVLLVLFKKPLQKRKLKQFQVSVGSCVMVFCVMGWYHSLMGPNGLTGNA